MILIDPGAITLVQNTFLEHLNDAFDLATRYALNLLYIFAAIELAVIGLFWALQQDVLWGRLFFKIIKIGLIFFCIQNYSFLLDAIIRSFAQLGGLVANTETLTQTMFNPATIWLYGYDVSIALLRVAANSSSIGLSLTQTLLGLGILLTLGLLGIQIVLQVVGFYLVSFSALIFMPFGAFNPTSAMFDQSVQSVLKAGVRFMVLVIIIGMALTVWHTFGLDNLSTTNSTMVSYNINQPLGLFFTALLFLYLAMRMPKLVSETVGQVVSRFGEGSGSTASESMATPTISMSPVGHSSSIQAAVSISPMMGDSGARMMNEASGASGGLSASSGSSFTPGTSIPLFSTNAAATASFGDKTLQNASAIEKSISEATIKKMKKTFLEVLEEKEKHDLLGR